VLAAAPDCTNARAPKAIKNRALLRLPHKSTLSVRSRLWLTKWPDSQAFVRHMTLFPKYVPEAGVRAIEVMLPAIAT